MDRNEEVEVDGDIRVETKRPAHSPPLSSRQYVGDERGKDEEADIYG